MRVRVFLIALMGLIALTGLVPVFAANTNSVFAGSEKGYAVYCDPRGDSVTFMDEKKKLVLTLTGPVLDKWAKGDLGTCLLSEPVWHVQNSQGVHGLIYRFANGIVVEYEGKAYFKQKQKANEWWPTCGLRRVFSQSGKK